MEIVSLKPLNLSQTKVEMLSDLNKMKNTTYQPTHFLPIPKDYELLMVVLPVYIVQRKEASNRTKDLKH